MGSAMVRRLLDADVDITLWNRTASKAADLATGGAKLVSSPADLADREVVFTMVSNSDSLRDVTIGTDGLLHHPISTPRVLVDCSTVSIECTEEIRDAASARGTMMLAAPVSGNPSVASSGRLAIAVSGPAEAFQIAQPWLNLLAAGVFYMGAEVATARLAKICHNLLLGITTQALAEMTVLGEGAGISRAALLGFVNNSVLGSTFLSYKTPALLSLDFAPTFTGRLLRKDIGLAMDIAARLDVPLPLAAQLYEILTQLIGMGLADQDFAALLELEARGAGIQLTPLDAVNTSERASQL
jgi:3-hydroxyisobutyrate dehydrogenase